LAARQHFFIRHPQQMGRELVGDIGPGLGRGQHIAAGNIHLIGQGQRDRVAGNGFVEVAVLGDDTRQFGGAPGFGDRQDITRPDAPARNGAGKTAKIEIGAIDPLHRHAERRLHQRGIHIHTFEIGEQRRALIPGRLWAFGHDINAITRRKRDRDLADEPELGGEEGEVRHDLIEGALRIIH
jgi:hypothetical protein